MHSEFQQYSLCIRMAYERVRKKMSIWSKNEIFKILYR